MVQEPTRVRPPVSELVARAASVFGLSPSEEKVLTVLIEERATNTEIGRKLTRSPKTVEFHLKNMLAKSGASDRVELVALVLGLGAGEQNSSDPGCDSE